MFVKNIGLVLKCKNFFETILQTFFCVLIKEKYKDAFTHVMLLINRRIDRNEFSFFFTCTLYLLLLYNDAIVIIKEMFVYWIFTIVLLKNITHTHTLCGRKFKDLGNILKCTWQNEYALCTYTFKICN